MDTFARAFLEKYPADSAKRSVKGVGGKSVTVSKQFLRDVPTMVSVCLCLSVSGALSLSLSVSGALSLSLCVGSLFFLSVSVSFSVSVSLSVCGGGGVWQWVQGVGRH